MVKGERGSSRAQQGTAEAGLETGWSRVTSTLPALAENRSPLALELELGLESEQGLELRLGPELEFGLELDLWPGTGAWTDLAGAANWLELTSSSLELAGAGKEQAAL